MGKKHSSLLLVQGAQGCRLSQRTLRRRQLTQLHTFSVSLFSGRDTPTGWDVISVRKQSSLLISCRQSALPSSEHCKRCQSCSCEAHRGADFGIETP